MTGDLRATLAAGQHEALLSALTDLEHLEARCRLSLDGLLDDLAHVLRGAPTPLPAGASVPHVSGARIDRHTIAILETLLLVHREVLTREPDRLFSVLHDELVWRDTLRPWAEHARAIVMARPDSCWLQRLRAPAPLAAALPFWRMSGDARALTSDGAHLLVHRKGPARQLLLVDVTTGLARTTFESDAPIGGRFSRDGARFVTFTGSTARLFATDTLALVRELGPQRGTIQRAVVVDDERVVFTMSGSEVRAWRVADGTSVTRTTTTTFDTLLPCGPDAVLFHERGTGWWRWDGATEATPAAPDCGNYLVVAVSPAGDCLIRHRDGAVLEGWALPDGTRRFEQATHGFTMSLAFDPSGACFVANDGVVRDATTGAEVRRLPGGASPYPSFDPLGRFVVTRHEEDARLWDLASGELVAQVRTGRIGDMRAHWSDDGRVLVLGDWRTTLVADVAALARVEPRSDPPVRDAWRTRFSPSGATLVVDHQGGVGFWDVARGVMRDLVEVTRPLTFFAGGSRVLVRDGDALVALATEDGTPSWRADLPRSESEYVHVADELGVLLLEQRATGVVVALAMADGRERYRLAGAPVALVDRDVFVTRTSGDGVCVRSTASGAETLALATARADAVAISRDRRWLAASHHRGIDVWDLTTRALHRTITYGGSSFWFRDDSAALVTYASQSQQSGSQDWNTECVFDVVTGACLAEKGWWDSEAPSEPPRELGPGVVLGAGQLSCETATGEVFVASTRGGHVELFVLRRSSRAP